MARACESCGRYLGARLDCVCGWAVPVGESVSASRDLQLPAPETEPRAEPDIAAAKVIAPPFWTGVRGVVADGRPVRANTAGGVVLGRLVVLAAIVVTVVLNWQPIIVMVTDAMVGFLMAQLIPIVVVVVIIVLLARFVPGTGGCLLLPLRLITLGAFSSPGRGTKADDGWDLVVETPHGSVATRIAADIPLEGGEEIVVHGPAYGGRKHAWLVQGIEPTFVRVGRGIVPLAVATIVIVIAIVLLFLRISAGQ